MRNKKGKKGPVWINTAHGAVLDLSATIYGPLAITRALSSLTKGGFLNDRYAVTHVPTGLTPGVAFHLKPPKQPARLYWTAVSRGPR